MKKVLIIAYYFPPLAGGGVQRPLKFCKYLPEFGWQPVVLTAKNGVGPVYDETLLDELNSYKDVKVYRTMSIELGSLKKLANKRISELTNYLKKIFFKRKCRVQSTEYRENIERLENSKIEKLKDSKIRQFDNSTIREDLSTTPSAPHIPHCNFFLKSNLEKIIKYLKNVSKKIYNIIFNIQKKLLIPDDKILWALPSVFSALRIIKKEKPDFIFVTIPPYSSFILATLLKKWTGIKLIVDYRDPWNVPFTKISLSNCKLEEWCLQNTVGIVYAWPRIKEILEQQFDIIEIKTELIYNGYDEDDYKDIEPKKFDKWTMISGGDLYGDNNIYFFKILEEFLEVNPDIKQNFKLIICSNYQQWFEDYLTNSPIKENIQNLGVLPKKEYLSYVKGADAACIFSYADYKSDLDIQIHGRVFDYLYFNKNLFIIGEKENTLTNFLDENYYNYNFGNIKNESEIKIKLVNSYHSKHFINNNTKLFNYSRKKLTNKLSIKFYELLDE